MSSENEVWAVLDNWNYTPVMVVREVEHTVWYRDNHLVLRQTRGAFRWRGTKEQAEALSQKLKSAKGERNRREADARIWFDRRVKELMETSGE